jgi:hypothetical protein
MNQNDFPKIRGEIGIYGLDGRMLGSEVDRVVQWSDVVAAVVANRYVRWPSDAFD